MKPMTLKCTCKAFTLIELLVVVLIIGVMIVMLLPHRHRTLPASSVKCMYNLKQVGLGLLMYASDHADQYPWQVSTNSTVTRDALESRMASEQFNSLSNYVQSLSAFICPTDKTRTAATNYSSFGNSNLSYFAALSATVTSGSNMWQLILAGDRHLSVSGQAVKPGFRTLDQSSPPGWTEELHKTDNKTTRGCLLFADGHVQFTQAKSLPKIVKDQPVTITRLVIP